MEWIAHQKSHTPLINNFSEKLNDPDWKYKVGICIITGLIVWVNGPFKVGRHNTTIFNEDGLKDTLCEDKCIEVDHGYQGSNKLKILILHNPEKTGCRRALST
eukprot:873839-Ditylum_brightwellii.AAC.1